VSIDFEKTTLRKGLLPRTQLCPLLVKLIAALLPKSLACPGSPVLRRNSKQAKAFEDDRRFGPARLLLRSACSAPEPSKARQAKRQRDQRQTANRIKSRQSAMAFRSNSLVHSFIHSFIHSWTHPCMHASIHLESIRSLRDDLMIACLRQ